MNTQDPTDILYFPNGEMNTSFILSNANLLLKEGEIELAASLFLLIKNQKKYSHCGHYGLGQCFLKMKNPHQAVIAFEKAFSLAKHPYIAAALIEALLASKEFNTAEKRTLEFAREFANDISFLELFRRQYQECISKQSR